MGLSATFWTCRARKVVNLVELSPERLRDIMKYERKSSVAKQLDNITFRASE